MRRGKKKEKQQGGADKSGKLITISVADVPTEKPRKLNVNADTAVKDVVELLLQSTPVVDGCKYGVALASDTSIVFSSGSSIAKIPEDTFVFRKVSIPARVYIPHLKQTETFVIDPSLSIADVILFIEHCKFKGSEYGPLTRPPSGNATPNHELVLVTSEAAIADIHNWSAAGNSQGVHMEFNRSLGSYRIKPDDMLVLKSATAKNQVWKDMTKTEIPLIISSDEFHLTKAFKYPGNVTFDEVVQKFLAKANMSVSKWFYGLYLDVAGEEQYLEPHWNIGSFPLPVPARLTCKAKPMTKVRWFGTDPRELPKAVDPDNGLEVPDILLLLKDMLAIVNGLEAEGIFRRAGLESEMKRLREQLNQGEKVSCKNPHTVGTMLKRWFKEVPVRLLEPLDKSCDPVRVAKNMQLFLDAESYVLFSWLVDLLASVADLSEVNKMTPSNLAIVWGPGLVGSSGDSAFNPGGFSLDGAALSGLDDTKFGIAVMEMAVELGLQRRRNGGTAPLPVATSSLVAAISAPSVHRTPPQHLTGSLTHNSPSLLAGVADVKLRAPGEGRMGRKRAASTSAAQNRAVRPLRSVPEVQPPPICAVTRSRSVAEREPEARPRPAVSPRRGTPQPQPRSPRQAGVSPRQGGGSPGRGRGSPGKRTPSQPTGVRKVATSPRRQQARTQSQGQSQGQVALALSPRARGAGGQGIPEEVSSRALPQVPSPGEGAAPRRANSAAAGRQSMIQMRPRPDGAFQAGGRPPPPLQPRQNAPPPLQPRQNPPPPLQPRGKNPPPPELAKPRGLPPPPLQHTPTPMPGALKAPAGQQAATPPAGAVKAGRTVSPRRVATPPSRAKESPTARQTRHNFDTLRVAYKTGGRKQSRRSTPNLPPPSSFRQMAAAQKANLPPPLPALPPANAQQRQQQQQQQQNPATRSCDNIRTSNVRPFG